MSRKTRTPATTTMRRMMRRRTQTSSKGRMSPMAISGLPKKTRADRAITPTAIAERRTQAIAFMRRAFPALSRSLRRSDARALDEDFDTAVLRTPLGRFVRSDRNVGALALDRD